MAFESLSKIAPALFSPEQDLIEVFNKKTGTIGVINPSYIKSSPSGVAGAIQFSNGSAFASDAANLFYDDTNNRLGIGTNAPGYPLEVVGGARIQDFTFLGGNVLQSSDIRFVLGSGMSISKDYSFAPANTLLYIKGSGSTSATTSLLVQNSVANPLFNINDAGQVSIGGVSTFGFTFLVNGSAYITTHARVDGNVTINSGLTVGGTAGTILSGGRTVVRDGNSLLVGGTPESSTPDASALTEIRTTTKGFLPPRMTTAQINAIVTPAEGLVAYNTTISHLCVYQSGAWAKLSHSPM